MPGGLRAAGDHHPQRHRHHPRPADQPEHHRGRVPNVSVNLPQNNLHLPGAYLSCLGLGGATEVALVIPAQVHVRSAMLNLQTGVLSLNNPTITVTGVGVNLFGLGLIVPMPPFPIQLPTITVPLAGLAGGGAAAG